MYQFLHSDFLLFKLSCAQALTPEHVETYFQMSVFDLEKKCIFLKVDIV